MNIQNTKYKIQNIKYNMKTETIVISNTEMTYHSGVSAQDNFYLIDASSPQDTWFHVEGLPSCHVVAVIPENEKLDKK